MSYLYPGAAIAALAKRLVAILCLVLLFASAANAQQAFDTTAFENYSGNVENGRYMAQAAGCAACHAAAGDSELLSGGLRMDSAIGEFYAPNITTGSAGIGGWTNAQFLNAVMRGIAPDGRHYYPVFPYASYAALKPEDVLDIKAYIGTLPASENRPPDHKIGFPHNQQATVAMWKMANFHTAPFTPGAEGQMARGKYLVEAAGHCNECHTPRTFSFGFDEKRRLQGEKSLTGAAAPAITPVRVSTVTAEAFSQNVLGGAQTLSGTPMSDSTMVHMARSMGNLTMADRNAIYAYLTGEEVVAPPPPNLNEAQCGVETAAAAPAGADPALFGKADAFVGKYCRSCHGPGERSQGAYSTGDLMSMARDPAFVTPGAPNESRLMSIITSGRMPIGPQPSAAEVKDLADWITSLSSETQSAPVANVAPMRSRDIKPFGEVVDLALRDIANTSELDRSYMRYFEFRQQYNAVFPCESDAQALERVKYYRAGFLKFLNSVSRGKTLVAPEPVPGSDGLLLRIDLRDLDWSEHEYNRLIAEYDYGIDPRSDTQLLTLALEAGTELPIMRADWFLSNASRPDLYGLLLDLPEHIRILEDRMQVDVDRNIIDRRVVRGGFFQGSSGVSDHNRMLERHDLSSGGYYWKSYDFEGDVRQQNLKQFPHGPEEVGHLPFGLQPFKHDGGEMIFSLPNGLQGYYLSTAAGEILQEGPTSVVSFRDREIGKGVEILNGRSCFSCHSDGLIAKRDQLREHIETSSLFTLDQRDLLLEMYAPQDEIDALFERDTEYFVSALNKIGATETTNAGVERSIRAPDGRTEIITWYADLYEDDMDYEAIAAEFGMTPEEFELTARRVADGETLRIALDWTSRLEAGLLVPRVELESQYAYLVGFLTKYRPLEAYYEPQYVAEPSASPRERYQPEQAGHEKLSLSLRVASTKVKVDDLLAFDLVANRDCEIQLFYVQENGKVLDFPADIVGDPHLKAGQVKHIPDANAQTRARFSEPASVETLVAYCRAGGLGGRRLSGNDAYDLVAKNGHGAGAKALVFELVERAEADNEEAEEAVHMVQFEVLP